MQTEEQKEAEGKRFDEYERRKKKENQGLIPDDFDQCQWHPIGDNLYIFGTLKTKLVVGKYAFVKRKENGSFDWTIADTRFQGNEPNKNLAICAVENIYYSAIKLRESLSDK